MHNQTIEVDIAKRSPHNYSASEEQDREDEAAGPDKPDDDEDVESLRGEATDDDAVDEDEIEHASSGFDFEFSLALTHEVPGLICTASLSASDPATSGQLRLVCPPIS